MDVDCLSEDSTSEASEIEDGSFLNRTESQVQKQTQVQNVLNRLGDHREPLQDLMNAVMRLAENVRSHAIPSEDAAKILQESRKRARNYGEDLLEDTLALDKLTGLFPEDRKNRKDAIDALEAFLEDVDSVKSELAKVEKSLDVKPALAQSAVAMEADEQNEESFDRTESQVQKQTKMHDILCRLKDHSEPVRHLREKVSRLAARMDSDYADLNSEQKVLGDCWKTARNCTEDMMQDMEPLDNLCGMFSEDRAIKKESIASLDALLEAVDSVKSDLAVIEKTLSSKLEQKAASSPGESISTPRTAETHGSSRHESPVSEELVREVPVPMQKFWEELELPLRFQPAEEQSCYTLFCRAAGLRPQEVNLELSPDSTHLIVSGSHLPATAEVASMRDAIAQLFLKALKRGQRTFDPHGVMKLYANMGEGNFGSFSQSFQLPPDADVNRIEASCDQGCLRVKIPKHMRRARPMHSPLFGGHPFFH